MLRTCCRTSKTVLVAALFICVSIHGSIQLYWFVSRPSPPEPDDAYTYILKSAQVAEGCAFQDCSAIEDLRRQLTASVADPGADWLRYRMFVRTSLVYHPLYTAIMLGLGKLGLTWEEAYAMIGIAGVILISSGLAYFLTVLWGAEAAAVAILLASLCAFREQGLLLWVVPSTLALGIAFYVWSLALSSRHSGLLLILVASCLLMHPLGRLYSAAAIPMLLLMDRPSHPTRATTMLCIAIACMVGASVVAPFLIDRPLLRIPAEPWPPGVTWTTGLLAQLSRGWETILSFSESKSQTPWMAGGLYVLAWMGFAELGAAQKRRVMAATIPLAGLCLISLGYVLPHYPAEAFSRVWIALAVVLLGGAGAAIVGSAGAPRTSTSLPVLTSLPQVTPQLIGYGLVALAFWSGVLALQNRIGKIALVVLLLGGAGAAIAGALRSQTSAPIVNSLSLFPRIVAWAFLAVALWSGALELHNKVREIQARGFETYLADQVHMAANECGTLLFGGETAALFYLSHGANRCHARYLLGLDADAGRLLEDDLKSAPRPLLLVAPQPGPQQIRVDGPYSVGLEFSPSSPREMWIGIASSDAAVVRVMTKLGAPVAVIAIQAGLAPGWHRIELQGINGQKSLEISATRATAPVFLEGIRFSSTQALPWPWGSGVILRPTQGGPFDFSPARLTRGLFASVEVLDSRGSTMLARVK